MERLKAKICLVGEKMVGKTSLIRRYVRDEFSDSYLMTIGTKVSKKEVTVTLANGRSVEVHLAIWDFMGQEGFRELLGDAYFSGARGILAVADVTRRPTLEALGPWAESVRAIAGRIPMILGISKCDLDGHAVYRQEDFDRFAAMHGCRYLRTSAKTGQNVEQAFRHLAAIVAEHQLAAPARPVP